PNTSNLLLLDLVRSFLCFLLDAGGFAFRSSDGLCDALLGLLASFEQKLLGARVCCCQIAFGLFRILHALANDGLPLVQRPGDSGKRVAPQDQENNAKADELREESKCIN